jgi:hypothetical protein
MRSLDSRLPARSTEPPCCRIISNSSGLSGPPCRNSMLRKPPTCELLRRKFRDTLTVPGGADDPVIEGMVTRPDASAQRYSIKTFWPSTAPPFLKNRFYLGEVVYRGETLIAPPSMRFRPGSPKICERDGYASKTRPRS